MRGKFLHYLIISSSFNYYNFLVVILHPRDRRVFETFPSNFPMNYEVRRTRNMCGYVSNGRCANIARPRRYYIQFWNDEPPFVARQLNNTVPGKNILQSVGNNFLLISKLKYIFIQITWPISYKVQPLRRDSARPVRVKRQSLPATKRTLSIPRGK